MLQGEEATLRCAASGFPNPVLAWSRRGRQLGSGLSLTRVGRGPCGSLFCTRMQVWGRAGSGLYTCTASNGVGSPANTTFAVDVQCKAKYFVLPKFLQLRDSI